MFLLYPCCSVWQSHCGNIRNPSLKNCKKKATQNSAGQNKKLAPRNSVFIAFYSRKLWGYWKEGRGGRGEAKIMRWLSIEGVRSQARCLMTEWELLDQVQQLLQSVANEHFERRQGCPGREMPTSLSSPADGFSCESKLLKWSALKPHFTLKVSLVWLWKKSGSEAVNKGKRSVNQIENKGKGVTLLRIGVGDVQFS